MGANGYYKRERQLLKYSKRINQNISLGEVQYGSIITIFLGVHGREPRYKWPGDGNYLLILMLRAANMIWSLAWPFTPFFSI